MMKAAVVLPTYNELENIRPMVESILSAAPGVEVIVVDDDSPDGTGHVADQLARRHARVSVIHRYENRGRGLAGVEAFRRCLERGFDRVIEMDADFSHDPQYIPELLRHAGEYDVVIGSRGTPGGADAERGPVRQMITRLAWLYLRIMLGVPQVHDPTSGYRCFTRGALQRMDLDTLRARGPAIVTEILFRCRKMRIREVPIRFRDRAMGTSKFDLGAMWTSLLQAARLRLLGK